MDLQSDSFPCDFFFELRNTLFIPRASYPSWFVKTFIQYLAVHVTVILSARCAYVRRHART